MGQSSDKAAVKHIIASPYKMNFTSKSLDLKHTSCSCCSVSLSAPFLLIFFLFSCLTCNANANAILTVYKIYTSFNKYACLFLFQKPRLYHCSPLIFSVNILEGAAATCTLTWDCQSLFCTSTVTLVKWFSCLQQFGHFITFVWTDGEILCDRNSNRSGALCISV